MNGDRDEANVSRRSALDASMKKEAARKMFIVDRFGGKSNSKSLLLAV